MLSAPASRVTDFPPFRPTQPESTRDRLARAALRWSCRLLLAGIALAVAGAGWLWWTRPRPMLPMEIFRGVVYRCEALAEIPDTGGLMHVVEIDLTTTGLELYVTPMDPEAVAAGHQYRMRWWPLAMRQERISVAVTAPLFRTPGNPWRLPGHFATATQTLIAEGRMNHVDRHSHLLWFEKDLTAHMEKQLPPPDEALRRAYWAVGGGLALADGRLTAYHAHDRDARTLAGLDRHYKKLYLAVFDDASPAAAARILADLGVYDAITLDGGDSTMMLIGPAASGGPKRHPKYPHHGLPVAFGVRAPELE